MDKRIIFLWLAYQLIFALAFIARYRKWVQPTKKVDGALVYNNFYYYTRGLFVVLFTFLILYFSIAMFIFGWRFDDWWTEAIIIFLTFCLGHIVFIASGRSYTYENSFHNFEVGYIVISALYICWFYIRIAAVYMSLFSVGAAQIVYLTTPDIRQGDVALYGDYYLSYSPLKKNIFIEKKVFLFSKDVLSTKKYRDSLCDFNIGDFEVSPEEPFWRVSRGPYNMIIQTNQIYHTGYWDFRLDSTGKQMIVDGYLYEWDYVDKANEYRHYGRLHISL